ncbi:uncharacterized protein [Nicotiana sylvestris]|uniref:uncharacterized protein n=1 Tax=Nicotiana sylvestris TaxID=4096 RepID=UPI00388C4123
MEPFPAAKDLGQGDPISPYLFARAMEYLSRLLGNLKQNKKFKYHPRCGKLGLQANTSKSAIYFGGVTPNIQTTLLQRTGYAQREMPFRYLGILLDTKKLTLAKWLPLIDKTTAKISSWIAKKLSYAGRIQLVQSLLFGMQTYWAQIFILPVKMKTEITSLGMQFFKRIVEQTTTVVVNAKSNRTDMD